VVPSQPAARSLFTLQLPSVTAIRERPGFVEVEVATGGQSVRMAWAACAKDPGFGPGAILESAARSARYSPEVVAALSFAGLPPDAAALSRD